MGQNFVPPPLKASSSGGVCIKEGKKAYEIPGAGKAPHVHPPSTTCLTSFVPATLFPEICFKKALPTATSLNDDSRAHAGKLL